MKAVQVLLDSKLPEKYRGKLTDFTAKGVAKFIEQVAADDPEGWSDVAKTVTDVGREATWRQGDTVGIEDLTAPFDKKGFMARMDKELETADRLNKTPQDKAKARMAVWQKYNDLLEKEVAEGSKAQNTPLGQAFLSGARGKIPQLKMMVGGTGLYADAFGQIVPVFGRASFAEGIRPVDYLASSYGARTTVVGAKKAVAKGGFMGKTAVSAASTLTVSEKDCGTANGIDLQPDDPSLVGRVLQHPVGDHKAGTLITSRVAEDIRRQNPEQVIVRSALTCQADHGVCARCAGAAPGGHLPSVGDAVGITAATGLFEPIAQNALNCLEEHTLVRMADFSSKAIKDIKVGDWVMGSDVMANTFPVQVTHVWNQGLQPVSVYTFKQGSTKVLRTLESTANHIMLVTKKVVSIENFRKFGKYTDPSHYLPQKLPVGYKQKSLSAFLPATNKVDGVFEPNATLLGVLLGDGNRWADKAHPVTFSCADLKQVEDLDKTLAPIGVRCVKSKRSYDWRIVGPRGGNRPNPVKPLLERWGLLGKYAHDKVLPAEVWTWDKTSAAAVIGGYLATDGSVFKTKDGHLGVSFSSCALPLLEGVRSILEKKFCVYSSAITCTGKAGTGNRRHDMFAFTVTRQDQVRKFAEQITLIPGVKQERLQSYIADASYKLKHTEHSMICRKQGETTPVVKQCYDLTVDHPDHLFVLHNSLIVSNSKHLSGQAGSKRTFSGLQAIENFLQMPDEFPDKALVSEEAGHVDSVTAAPQGGHYVKVGETDHYIPQGYEVMVKPGQKVEAGQQLSEGIVNPADVVRLRGLGEGRRFYAQRLKQLLDDSGQAANMRNTEMLARAAIDHVEIGDEGEGGYLPDDLVSYNRLSSRYHPPSDSRTQELNDKLEGKILQAPALHYSIGTKLTGSMIDRLKKTGMTRVVVSDNEPGFTPASNRLATAAGTGEDWLSKQQANYLKSNLQEDAMRGRTTNIKSNEHWAPVLAASPDFAKNVTTEGKF